MGDYSREPGTRLADAVNKHYVAVRMQQGVPILDADWNEMEDLRRFEFESVGARFIGSGVPSGSDGFRVMETAEDNDFIIRRGMILVKGKKVINEEDNIRYSTQPNQELAADLTQPASDTSYVVYLDTWEREAGAGEDEELIDSRIGIETCLRLKREWVVQVAEGGGAGDIPAGAAGHAYYPLALLRREGGNARIHFEMMTDLRRTHLTLADGTKAPLAIYGPLGTVTFSIDNFHQMLDITEEAYFNLLKSDLFMMDNFSSANSMETVMLSTVFNTVMQIAKTASIQAKIKNIDNPDGLRVMEDLYRSQARLVETVVYLIAGNPDKVITSQLMEKLNELLEGGAGGIPPGLKNALLTDKDLKSAVEIQQEINREIGNRTRILPHGHLAVQLTGGPSPGTTIHKGNTYRYEFRVAFEATTPEPPLEETFDLMPAMTPPGWNAGRVGSGGGTLTMSTGEEQTVAVDIEIPLDTTVDSAALHLRVRSQRNPSEMDVTNTEVALVVDSGTVTPNPLQVELTSPAINVAEDVLSVGMGGPFGLPGKGVNLRFKYSYTDEVEAPENFTVHFAAGPAGVFETPPDTALSLGGSAGQEEERLYGFQATDAAVNGTDGTLTVTMTKDADPESSAVLVINLNVNKS